MKKLVVAFLTMVLCVAMLSFAVSAQEQGEYVTEYLTVESLIHGDIPELSPRYSDVSLLEDAPDYALYELMLEAIETDNLEIDLTEFNSTYGAMTYVENQTPDVIQNAYDRLLCSHPEFFYISNAYGISYNPYNNDIVLLVMKYSMPKDEIEQASEFFENAIDAIVSIVPDSFTDYEKVLFVNEYITTNFEYDTDYRVFDAYKMLKQGKAVCQGYTILFTAIMDKLEIPVDYCASRAMKHVWNYVQLDGNWYHIDLTWNDPVTDIHGLVLHSYFLLSDGYIQTTEDNKDAHHSYNSFYSCTDTTFDGLGAEFDKAFVVLDGRWYTTAYDSTKTKSYIYELDTPYFPEITFDNPVVELGIWHYGATTSYYPGNYSYPMAYGNYMLYNNEDSVCVFDGENTGVLYTPDNSEGLRIYCFEVWNDTVMLHLSIGPRSDEMADGEKQSVSILPVTYLDSDGSVVAEAFAVEGGDVPEMLVPENPEKENDEYYSYTFSNWEQTDDNEYTAVYTKEVLDDVEIIVDDNLEYYNKHGSSIIKFALGLFKHIGHHAFDDNEVKAIVLPDDVEDVQADSFEGVPNAMVYLSRRNQKLHDSLKGFNLMQHRYLEDMNFDRAIDILDFRYLVSEIVHGKTSELDSICADMNEDGDIDLKDVRELVRNIASE